MNIKLVAVTYPESRLEFFKEQLAAAQRRLDWSIKHREDWYDHAEKGEVVAFYEWAVQMAEEHINDKMEDALDELFQV